MTNEQRRELRERAQRAAAKLDAKKITASAAGVAHMSTEEWGKLTDRQKQQGMYSLVAAATLAASGVSGEQVAGSLAQRLAQHPDSDAKTRKAAADTADFHRRLEASQKKS